MQLEKENGMIQNIDGTLRESDDPSLSMTELAASLTKPPSINEVARTGEDREAGQFGAKLSQATVLVNLASSAELFHTPSGRAFATVRLNGPTETFAVRSADFRSYLWRLYYEQYNRAVGSQAVQDALSVLEAKARFDGPEMPVFCRVAELNGIIYLDLANARREVVVITPSNWFITTDVPVRFRRLKAMLPLPTPIPGGKLAIDLKPFINAEENDFILIVAWLFATIQPCGAYPILQIKGEQGSAKSTTSKLLRNIIDPNEAPARAQPRDERDVVIALSNSHVGCFDNLSFIPEWLSDALCRVSTGQCFSTRTLHTDEDESIFAVKRPIIINGI